MKRKKQSGKKIKNDDVSPGRFISLVLRHDPAAAGITVDGEDWA